MLIGLDPLLNGDVLGILRDMGHGDSVVLADANFPAHYLGPPAVRIDCDAVRAGRAVLSVMPLDGFVEHPALRMEIVGKPKEIPPVQQEVQKAIDRAEGRKFKLAPIERMAFYERARKAYCVITTGERRFYGCFILKKGVIPPSA